MFSVVTLSKNPANCIACVNAVFQYERDLPRERIIVVDDGAREEAESKLPGVTWLSGEKPFIFPRNANVGLRHAFAMGSDAVMLLNDDALLCSLRGFGNMSDICRHSHNIGLLSAVTNSVGNQEQMPRNWPKVRWEQTILCFIAVMIPRRTWELVGEMDERYSLDYGCDDGDYCHRVKNACLQLGIWDGCFVDHLTLPSTYRENGHISFEQNKALFEEKWGIKYGSK